MPRCPKGSRKNKKTGNCDAVTSNSSPASKKASASPASATKKVRKVAKAKIYLTEEGIDHIINANMETIEYKGVSRDKMKQVLSKVYFKPRFESEFYAGRSMKRQLKKRKVSADDIIDELLAEQAYALIREWGKSYITLADFTSSQSFYSHSSE
jgi:stage V sporulation protein SpoVS